MHISLDSALGRQRRLNSVGESVFQIAPNAAAGYSLRSLTGGDPAVVRVRRESDNAERDFNASGVSSGELVNWVNQQITPPLDLRELTATGRDGPIIDAAVAYSLRNLSDSYTGNVVEVRRSSDNATRSFTAAEVADGTLTDWVNVGKNYVGYARFQDSTTANVNLTSSFTLEATNNWSIKFGYIGGSTITGLFGSSGNSNTGFWFGNLSSVGITDDSGFFSALSFGGALALKIGQHHEIEFFNTPAEGVRVKVDGVTMLTTPKTYGDITLNKIGVSRSRDGERVIENVRIDLNGDGTLDYSYAGDGNQASNWTDRVGSNNGTPTAQVLTYNNEYTSGTVSTWYDQSTTAGTPNANHAVQTDAASQPKIVDAGVLVTEGGKPAFNLDGVDDKFQLSSTIRNVGDFYISLVSVFEETAGLQAILGANTNSDYLRAHDSAWLLYTGTGAGDTGNVSWSAPFDNRYLMSFNRSGSTVTAQLNGSSAGTGTNGTDIGFITKLFQRGTNTSQLWKGNVQEMIFYDTDQTDNRTALEANIGEVYSIAGIPAYDDTVNGFVETWYDQSGNDNDAVQETAGSQPKIVDAGVLVTGGLDFDGVDDFMLAPDGAISVDSSFILSQSDSSAVQAVAGTNTAFNYYGLVVNATTFRFGQTGSLLDATVTSTTEEFLSTLLQSDGNVYLNGSLSASGTVNVDGDDLTIGARQSGSSAFWSGAITEAIFYPSDQSANREAIETNINNQYDIY